jgi:hypothetical protein
MSTITKDDLEFLDLLAKTLSRQLAWHDEQGMTATLRKPLRETLADLVGVDLEREAWVQEEWAKDEPPDDGMYPTSEWAGSGLAYRHQRLALRGLVLYWYRDLFQGESFRSDRYAYLSRQLALFGQELV